MIVCSHPDCQTTIGCKCQPIYHQVYLSGWYCPNCHGTHGPAVQTCPITVGWDGTRAIKMPPLTEDQEAHLAKLERS